MPNDINQLVTCGGLDCSVCLFLAVAQSAFNWLLGISTAMAVIMLVFAGFNFLLNNGDTKLINRSKTYVKYSVAGFVFVLISFWIFNAFYLVLGANNKASWFKIDCLQERTFSEKKDRGKTSDQAVWTNNLGLAVVGGSSIQGAINDSQKIVKLDLSNFDANNLLLDVLKMNPEQVIKLIATDRSIDPSEVINYINVEKGYADETETTSQGDRMAGNFSEEKMLEIKKEAQGAISASGGGQELVVDPGSRDKMKEFQEFLTGILSKIKAGNADVYAYSGVNQESYSWNNQDSCESSGGTWKTFASECEARRQAVCGQQNLECSGTQNELSGCQCPEGSCLRFGKCVEAATGNTGNSDSDNDGVPDSSDYCPKTPKGEQVDQSSSSDVKGCSCSQINLQSRKCPATRCEGSNLVKYAGNVKDKCLNGKIIKDPCNPTGIEYNQQCNQLKDISQISNLKQTAIQGAPKDWVNNLNNAISGSSNIPHPNDSINNWEKSGKDEGGAYPPSGSEPNGQGPTGTGQTPTGTGPTESTSTGPVNNDTGMAQGGSEEAHALEQKLVKIPEGILANNRSATPYMMQECMPKLQQAAVELDKARPGWKIYPSSIFRSDQKQTRMWDRSSKNTTYIAKPIARGGGGSAHSFGNAGDFKFQDANGRIINMSSNDKALLRQVMEKAGMIPYNAEWWHFYCIKPFQPPEHRPKI